MHKILFEIRTRSLSFTSIKVLLLPLVARLLHLIKLIEETILRFRIVLDALITYRVYLMSIILRSRYLSQDLGIGKIGLAAVANRDAVELVILWLIALQTVGYGSVLVGHLLLYLLQAAWNLES